MVSATKVKSESDIRINLQSCSDSDLLKYTQGIAASERKIYSQVIEALDEIDRRKLYLKEGYPSLFSFCTEFLKYSGGAAQRRIESMRLLKNFSPALKTEVKEKLETGRVNLTHLSHVSKAVRHMPHKLSENEKAELIRTVENTTTLECEKKLIEAGAPAAFKREDVKILNSTEVRLSVSFDQETYELLQKFIALTAHKNPWASKEKALKMAIEMAVEQVEKKKFGLSFSAKATQDIKGQNAETLKKSSKSKRGTESDLNNLKSTSDSDKPTADTEAAFPRLEQKRTRYIPVKIKKEVWRRDEAQCQYIHPGTNQKCNATRKLQVDHIHEFSKGGGHESTNLRLLCASHNRHRKSLETG